MAVATFDTAQFDFGTVARTFAPGSFTFDPFGLVSGYKAYLIYTGLSARSDSELADMGIERTDVPRVAFEASKTLRH